MKHRKKLIGIVLFFLLAFGSLIPISYMLRPADSSNGEVRRRMTGFYAEEEDSLNAVILGSSAVYRYVNNPLLWEESQITSYNFAVQGLSIFTLENLVDEVEKTQSPELYIIDARKFILTEDTDFKKRRFQQLVSNLKYSKNRCDLINKMIENPLERIYYYFDIMIYHDNWEKLTKESLEYMDNERPHALKGWSNVKSVESIEAVDVSDVTEEIPLSDTAEQTLRSLLEKCRKEGKEVLMLATPWKISKDNQKKSNYTKKLTEEYGYAYLDMNQCMQELKIDFSSDFYNKRHANAKGAKKVTEYLAVYLQEHYSFSKVEEEAVTESWNAAAEKNREQLEQILK